MELGLAPRTLPSGGGRDEKAAAEAGNWRDSKLTHWKKLRQELGSGGTGRSLAKKGEEALRRVGLESKRARKNLKVEESSSGLGEASLAKK